MNCWGALGPQPGIHAGLQEVDDRQLEGLAALDQTHHHLAVLAVPQGLNVPLSTGPHSQTGLHLQLGRTRSSPTPRSPDEQGGEVPVLPVLVSQEDEGRHHQPLHSVQLVDSQPGLARQSSLSLS